MIKAAIEKILTLNENRIHEINGEYYTEKELERIVPPVDRPKITEVSSLDSLVKLIQAENAKGNASYFCSGIQPQSSGCVYQLPE